MSKATAVLLGMRDEFDVLSVDRLEPGQVKIIIESVNREGACPACGASAVGSRTGHLGGSRTCWPAVSRRSCGGGNAGWSAWTRCAHG